MGADRNQWQFPKNEVGKVLGWSDEFSPSNPNASKGLVNKDIGAIVDLLGFVKESDTSTVDMQFVIDEDDMASNSATKVPTQQSVKAYVDAKQTFETKATLAAKTVPASIDTVLLVGNTATGDDFGGDPVLLVRSPSATVGYLPDAAATKFAYLSRTIKLSKAFHGADTSGAGNNSVALIAAIDEIIAKGGGEIKIPAGQYLFTTGLANKIVACNLVMTWHPDAQFVAAAGFTVPLLYIRGGAGTARINKRVVFNAPRIDMSLGLYTGNQPSAINLSNYEEAYVNDPNLYGGASRSGVDLGGGNFQGGDSGIEPLNISYFECRGGKIKGFLDNGIYAGGQNDGSTADDGIEYAAIGTKFENNQNGFNTKRSGFYMKATGCIFYNNGIGVVTAEVPLPQDGGTAQRMDITDCLFTRNARAAEFRAQTKGRFNNNTVEDWGYLENLTTIVANAADRRALTLNGARSVSIDDNRFRMVDLATNAHIAVDIRNYTDANAVVWTGGAAVGGNNTTVNVERPLVEAAGVTQSILGFQQSGGVSATWTAIANGTIIRIDGIGNSAQTIRVGNAGVGLSGGTALYTQPKELFHFVGTSTYLSAIGSLAAAGTSATISIPVTGAASGDLVIMTPLNAAALNPRLNYAMRAVTNAVEVVVSNDHTVAVDFTALSFTLEVTRRDA